MNFQKSLNKKRSRRVARNRAVIFGIAKKPRLAVFRSNKFIYAQLINDESSKTLAHVSSAELGKDGRKKSKIEIARLTGGLLAKKAAAAGVKSAVFDRRSYKYHGRVKSLAEGARAGGLKF